MKKRILFALSALTVWVPAQFIFASSDTEAMQKLKNSDGFFRLAQVSKTDTKTNKLSASKKTFTKSKKLKLNKALEASKSINKKSQTNLVKILKPSKSSGKKPTAKLPGTSKYKVPTKGIKQNIPPVNTPGGKNVTPYQYVPPVEPAEPTKTETQQQVYAPIDKPDSQQNDESSNEDIIDLLKQVLAQNEAVQPDVPQTSFSEAATAGGEDKSEVDDPEDVQLLKDDLEAILKIIKPEQNELILSVLEIDSEKADLGNLRLLASYIRKYMESQVE